jgi:hypothetical protein
MPNTYSFSDIFVDLGFSRTLADMFEREAAEMSIHQKAPDIGLLIEFRKVVKKLKSESDTKLNKISQEISVLGDYRDSDGVDEAYNRLQLETARNKAFEEVSYKLKEFINQHYGALEQ